MSDHSTLLGDYLGRLRSADVEMLAIVHIGQFKSVIARRLSSSGSIEATPFPIRTIVADALNLGSLEILLAHNHPSGAARPSAADLAETRNLGQVLASLRVTLIDHLIVTNHSHYSMRGGGLI